MIRRFLLIVGLLLCATGLHAQTQNVTVTGTILDPGGVPYQNATVTALAPPNSLGVNATTSTAGSFSMSLPVATSGGSQYMFSVSTQGILPPRGTGPQSFQIVQQITAATDISAALRAAAPALTLSSGNIAVSGGPCTVNCIYAANPKYGGLFDVQVVTDATWASNGTTVTISGTDPPFTGADNGKLCFGMPFNTAGPSAAGSFTFLTATTGTCGPSGSLVGAPSSNGVFGWGHDATPALKAATADLYALSAGGTLVLPPGKMFLSAIVGNTGAGFCNAQYPSGISLSGCRIMGGGVYETYIIPLPGFNFAGCVGHPFWGPASLQNFHYDDFSIDGLGQTLSGVSTSPCNSLFGVGGAGFAERMNLVNWGGSAPNGPNGINVTGQGAFLWAVFLSSFGATPNNLFCNGQDVSIYQSGTTSTLEVNAAASCYDYGGSYTATSVQPAVFNNGGTLALHGSILNPAGSGTQPLIASNDNSLTYLEDVGMGGGAIPTGAFGIEFFQTQNSKAFIRHSTLKGGATGATFANSASGTSNVWDEGGNTYSSPIVGATGKVLFHTTGTNNPYVLGACTGVVTASQTLGLFGTGPNVTATTCTSTTIGSGIVMSNAGTVISMTVTATAAGVNASSGAVTVLKNGASQTMTCTIGTGTSCQDVTHTISVVAGDLISIQFTTQAADTLAGVKVALAIQ